MQQQLSPKDNEREDDDESRAVDNDSEREPLLDDDRREDDYDPKNVRNAQPTIIARDIKVNETNIGTAGNVLTGEHASMTMSGDQHIYGNTATQEKTKPEKTVSTPTPPASGSTDSTPDIRPGNSDTVAIAEGQDRRGGEEGGAVGGVAGGVGSDEGVSESPELPVSRGPSEMWRRSPRLVNKFRVEGCILIYDLCETDGECWVSVEIDEIRRVDVGGNVRTTRRVGEVWWCLGLTRDRTDLYVSCIDGCIYRRTRTGDGLTLHTELSFVPGRLASDPRTGDLLVCGGYDRRVYKVTRSGDVTPLSHVRVQDATAVAVNRRGDMAVCDYVQGRVSVFPSDGLPARKYDGQTTLTETFSPWAVTCDSEGNFVVVDDNSMITVLDRHGERVTSFTTTEDCDGRPWSVSMAATGRLWVGFLGGHVCVYDVK
ncbi:hypothetical protein ScPMuIL_002329 [Solemya velum]